MSVPQRDGSGRVPMFNSMPPAIVWLGGLIVASYLVGAIYEPARIWWINTHAVIAFEPGQVLPAQPLGNVLPYLTHVLVHFGLLHLTLNMAVLISAGRAVADVFGRNLQGSLGFLIFFATCSVAGALLDVYLHSGEPRILGGASTGVSGLIAAAGWVMGGWRGMLGMALPWIGINILLGLTGTVIPIPIGWAAHIGGTIAGAILFPPLVMLMRDHRR
jgi:membrane associated rhomboid family serine protease